ncbi:MAG: alpha-2-macroglobulin family protein, partial [Desulfobacteraceae bacterium]|nr:alpha-2-macroglobulin family protein [Desulfobacteraceae bacterium]
MNRISIIILTCIFSILFFSNSAFAFDEAKAKKDYQGARFKVSVIKESLYKNAPAIEVMFTVPLAKKYLKKHYVTLKNDQGSEYFILSKDQTKVIFPFVTPDKSYTVVVLSEVRDINNQKLDSGEVKNIKTKKISPYVSFTSSGHILSSSSPKRIPVTTLNINEVDIEFFAIDRAKIFEFLNRLGKTGRGNYYRINEIRNYGKLVHSGRFALNPRKNQRTEYNIELDGIKSLSEPGLYAAVMKEPGTYKYRFEYTYFMHTDIGLHARRYTDTFDVYAQDITTGKPIDNVRLELISLTSKNTKTSEVIRTDKKGKAQFHIKPGQNCIVATKGNQFSILRLNNSALDLSALKNAKTSHSEYQIFSWGPRDLYRPSETVTVNMLVRDYDGRMAPEVPLTCTIYKPDGSRGVSEVVSPSFKGFYQFEYKTSTTSQTGKYKLQMTFANSNKANYLFQVEEFLPERMDLELFDGTEGKKLQKQITQNISVPVKSNYLYGAPASDNKVDGEITAMIDLHPFEDLSTFYFGDPKEKIEYKRKKFQEINLGKDGTGVLQMINQWGNIKSPVRLNINASVYESGGRPITRNAVMTLLGNDCFFGVEPQFKGKPDSNTTVAVKIGCVDSEARFLKNKSFDLSLIRKDRNWFWQYNDSQGWHWEYDETPVVVFSKSVNIGNKDTVLVNLPLKWGKYRVEITDGKALTGYEFATSWSWWGNATEDNGQKPDLVSLGFDKTTYQPGETAKLVVNPPEDGLALITIESSKGVLYSKYAQVQSKGTTIDIKTDRTWNRHDLYASVMVIKPGDMKETPAPSRSFGMIHLPLKRNNRVLNVTIDAPLKIEPNKKISAKITLNADYPLPKETKVIVALVDVGILNITRCKTPDAASYFFGPRRYNVDLYDNYAQIIDNLGPIAASQRFGGGFREAMANLARGGDKPKSEVMMVSFFSNPLSPDENGQVIADFDLPNFNGQLRWMVMAFADEQFGKVDTDTKVADKIVTQVSMPRFLAKGDNSVTALDLRNMSGIDQKLSIRMTMQGALLQSEVEKEITLKDKEKTIIHFPIQAVASQGQGIIKLVLLNEDKDINIKRTWKLGVRSPYPYVTRSSSEIIKIDSSWKPELETKDLLPETIQFQMTLSDKPPMDFNGHFEYLLRYPYGCIEQSVSSGYPWVLATLDKAKSLGLDKQIQNRFKKEYTEEFRIEQVNKAVDSVLKHQKTNGSFGSWSSTSPEQKWLTVYAAEFLNDAKKAGGSVNKASLDNVNKKINKYLRGIYSDQHYQWSMDSSHYEFAFKSYAGYVLSKIGMARLSDLRRLMSIYKDKTEDDGLSWMYMAVSFKNSGDAKNADICFEKAKKEYKRKEHRYYGEYGSNIRDLARIVELSLVHDFDSGDLIFKLANILKKRQWLSTQERNCLFKAALSFQK